MQRRFDSSNEIVILNPKLYKESYSSQESRIFPYYAGYSSEFSKALISSLSLTSESIVLDPWNGSGTTTKSAHDIGVDSIGFDLNPAMVVVAKARLLSPLEHPSLISIAKNLIEQSRYNLKSQSISSDDPLLTWFSPCSAHLLRVLERSINHVFISNSAYLPLKNNMAMDKLSPLAAFLYVSLFRTVRRLLIDFTTSNPTWIKSPKSKYHRKRPSHDKIFDYFLMEIKSLILRESSRNEPNRETSAGTTLGVGNAEKILLPDNSIDAIVSSPPYCTRIDYAVSTTLELATLQFNEKEFDSLRRSLTGTSTVEKVANTLDESWGKTCVSFLDKLYSHPSRASQGYYYKNHLQYFRSLFNSLREISRTLKADGLCFLVVQNSHYKEIHNDVPTIVSEMADGLGLKLFRRDDFLTAHSMVKVNLKSKKYLSNRNTTESVLCFKNYQ